VKCHIECNVYKKECRLKTKSCSKNQNYNVYLTYYKYYNNITHLYHTSVCSMLETRKRARVGRVSVVRQTSCGKSIGGKSEKVYSPQTFPANREYRTDEWIWYNTIKKNNKMFYDAYSSNSIRAVYPRRVGLRDKSENFPSGRRALVLRAYPTEWPLTPAIADTPGRNDPITARARVDRILWPRSREVS